MAGQYIVLYVFVKLWPSELTREQYYSKTDSGLTGKHGGVIPMYLNQMEVGTKVWLGGAVP